MPRKWVDIDVTPVSQVGSTVNCVIDPPSEHKKNGHIRLDKGETYRLRFTLRDGNLPNLQFKPQVGGSCDAFWSDQNTCPSSAMSAPQYSDASNGPKKLEVNADVEPGGAPIEIHYRLNFNDGRSFDPIIIHE